MFKENHFDHKGRQLTVGAEKTDNEFIVRVYEQGKPIGPPYNLTIETVFDGKARGFDLRLLDETMAIAEADVVEGVVTLPPGPSN
jgi:hypothetical protein